MTISLAVDSDLPGITELFKRSFGADAKSYPTLRIDGFYVAKTGEDIVGAGKLYRSSLHGNVPIMVIGVEPSYRRQGVGRAIHQAIMDSKPSIPLGIDGCCYETDSGCISFLESLGYESYLDCLIPAVDISSLPKAGKSEQLEIMTFSKAFQDGVSQREVLRFLVSRYVASHGWSPPSISETDASWEEIALGDIDPEVSMLALSKGTIVGASTGWLEDQALEVQWTYGSGTTAEQIPIIHALLTSQFQAAHSRNAKRASMECDSTEQALLIVVKGFKIISSESWKRFRYLLPK